MFAMIGCTDFQEDIDQVAGDVERVKAELTKLQGELTAAQDELEDLAKLDGEVKTLKDAQSKLQTSVSGLEASVKTINEGLAGKADEAALKEAVATLNASIATINTNVSTLQASLADYAKKSEVEKVKTDLATAQKAADEAKKAADEAKKVADAAATAADLAKLSETVSGLQTSVSTLTTNLSALTTRVETAENNIKTLQTEVAKIAEIQAKLDKMASSDDLEKANDAIASAKTTLKAVKLDVEALANQIQSVVFVPEYVHGSAQAERYNVDGERVSANETLNLTFKVTPAKFAKVLADDFAKKEGKAYDIVLNSVKTKAAEADVKVEIKNITLSNNAGRIEVEAVATDAAQGDDYALSLEVKELTTKANEGAPVSHVVSSYVPVVIKYVDIKDWFSIRKGGKTAYADQDIKMEWSATNSKVDYYSGYDVYMAWNGGYVTLAEAKKVLNLTKDITYKYEKKNNIDYSPSSSSNGIKVTQTTKSNTLTGALVAEFKNNTPKSHVGNTASMTSKVTIDVAGEKIVIETADTYEIVRRTMTITLEDLVVDWSFKTALALSNNNPATPYVLPLDENFDNMFKEVAVVSQVPAVLDENFNLEDILVGITPTLTVKLNNANLPSAHPAFSVAIDPVAVIKAKLTGISVSGYQFPYNSTNKANKYAVAQVYGNSAEETDVTFKFNLTLNAIPYVSPVAIAVNDIVYDPTANPFKYVVSDALALEKAFAPLKNDFTNFAEFKTDLRANSTGTYTGKIYKEGKKTPASNVTTLNNDAQAAFYAVNRMASDDKSYIKIVQNIVKTFDDTFEFKSVYATWYGATITFNTTASISKPAYVLGLWSDLVKDGVVTLKGEMVSGTGWVIKQDKLENYFRVINNTTNSAFPTGLEVAYEIVKPYTTATDLNKYGYVNFPSITTPSTVGTDGSLTTSPIDWATYTARDLKIKATLNFAGIKLDDEVVTLKIQDPISWNLSPLTVTRVPNKDCTINLWEAINVFGINSPADDLVDANGFKWTANKLYGMDIEFLNDVDNSVEFWIGDMLQQNVPATKLNLSNLTSGEVVYHAGPEAAESVNVITIKVPVKLTHKFNYNNVMNTAAEKAELIKMIEITIPANI